MRVTSLRFWHWMAIGLVGGLLCGSARSGFMNFSDELTSYGSLRIGQREFERAIVEKFQGKPRFTQMVVYPYRLSGSSAGAVTVHVVCGMYWDGQMQEEGGRLAARWQPAYFVASAPYRPLGEKVEGAGISTATHTQFADVLSYLDSLKKSAGVQFRYASWWWATRPVFLWTCGGFLFVGIVWPVVINLLTYGTVLKPHEPKAISLAAVKSPAAAPQPAQDQTELLEVVQSLDAELEAGLKDQPAPIEIVRAVPQPLSIAPLEPIDAAAQKEKEFGAKNEDFYPTELGAKHTT